MGCGSSQAVSVVNTSPLETDLNPKKPTTESKSETKPQFPSRLAPLPNIARYDSGISSKVDSNSTNGSDNISDRRNSISSNSDSFCLEGEYKSVITEKSKKELVNKIENDFVEKNNLQLTVNGKGCPPLLSEKEKEKASQEILKSNGLILKPIIQKPNSAHFEIKAINAPDNKVIAPPPRLARERTKVMTAEEIQEKLEKANQRKIEQIRMKSSISMDRRDNESFSDALVRQASIASSQRPLSAVSRQLSANLRPKSSHRQFSANSEEVIERQKKLREIRDKLKARDTKNGEGSMTPRSKEIADEMDVFRPKTPAAFRPEF